MKLTLALVSLVSAGCLGSRLRINSNKLDIDEKEFEERFDLPAIEDLDEYMRRDEALKKTEEKIKVVNDAYEKGELTWFEDLNEYSDLPDDEFNTGLISEDDERLLPEDRARDQISELYFDQFRSNPESIPSYYSSRDQGHVSSVKRQRACGSCVAFATMGAVETCIARITNVTGDYSEQQMMDCGYQVYSANGCDGSGLAGYGKWMRDVEPEFAHESDYPYKAYLQECPANIPAYNQGARVSGFYITSRGDEELMKQMVYKHGAVIAAIGTDFRSYAGGIYAGCMDDARGHAVLVVGYGTENGVDYWLVKNSWGPNWAENGYIRLKRGVGMCGIGKHVGVVLCSPTSGPTDAPLPDHCADWKDDCSSFNCGKSSAAKYCAKSCGLC